MRKYPNKFNSEKSRKRCMRKRTGRKPFSLTTKRQFKRASSMGTGVSQMLESLGVNQDKRSLLDKAKAMFKGDKR